MNYKEKYEKALERAKSAIKECGYNNGRIAMIETIFPELAESEDERIRESIIADIKSRLKSCTHTLDDYYKKQLAWLEKQGLQMLANSAKNCEGDEEDWSEEDEILHNQKE